MGVQGVGFDFIDALAMPIHYIDFAREIVNNLDNGYNTNIGVKLAWLDEH